MEPKVIYEDSRFVVVDKPEGLLVHPVPSKTKEATLVDWLLQRYPEIKTVGDDPVNRPGIVHRLDKTTSGIMIIARTQEYFEYLKSLFQKGEMKKTYYAVVYGIPKEIWGVIDKPIGIGVGTLKRSTRSFKMRKEAVTEYEVLGSVDIEGEIVSILRVHPRTGRTHQIRVHLLHIGHPILGDRVYGRKKQADWIKRIMLHAYSLEWTTKDGSRMKLESDLPQEFKVIHTTKI